MIELKGINKRFDDVNAVSDLTFTIKNGETLGLIGQNGAGKSTTFRMILDFIQPDTGEILWDGHELSDENRKSIGFMPEERGLYQKDTIKNQLKYFSELHGMKGAEFKEKLDSWMKRLRVRGNINDKVEMLSKGNAQKVQLIATLMFEPQLLILDEPFSGLDPVNADILVNEIQKLKKKGTMVIFSSHNMTNVEYLSNEIVMLNKGKTVLKGSPNSIYKEYPRLDLRIDGYEDVLSLEKLNGVESITRDNRGIYHLKLKKEETGKTIFNEIAKRGYIPTFDQAYPSLDDIFRMKVEDNGD